MRKHERKFSVLRYLHTHARLTSLLLARAGAGCAPNTHLCYVSYPEFRCLPLTQVCDGEINCVGATDEANCG